MERVTVTKRHFPSPGCPSPLLTSNGPQRWGMSGPERAMLYRLAVETALRASELRHLTRQDFHLDGDEPSVTVVAGYNTKQRLEVAVPLQSQTAIELRAFLAAMIPTAVAFNMPAQDHLVDMLKADLKAAGIPYRLDPKHGKVSDFHSLQHTTGSWMAAAGVHRKVIQRVMRHSTITLTMDRYTHAFKSDEADAVAKLPDLSGATGQPARATGTDDVYGDPQEQELRGAPGGQPWTETPYPVDSSTSICDGVGQKYVDISACKTDVYSQDPNAGGGTRTPTGFNSQRILNPPRLPIPPHRRAVALLS